MSPIEFQIIDLLSTINKEDTRDLDRLQEQIEAENEELSPDLNLYAYPNQRALSYKNETIIKLFGRTSDDRSILVNVEGFQTFFYLGFWTNITSLQAEYVVNNLKRKVNKRFLDHLVRWELSYQQPYEKFVGNDKFPFIKLYFKNNFALKEYEKVAMQSTKVNIAYGVEVDYYIGESNLDEILKFLHVTDLLPASWVQVEDFKTRINKTGYCQLEIDCHFETLKRIDKVTNASFKIMIYDLECQSMLGELGEFPVAKKNYQKLARELIDLKLTHKNHVLIQDPLKFPKVLETCLLLAFTPHFYPSQIQQVMTINNLKPSPSLIEQLVKFLVSLRENCVYHSSYDDTLSSKGMNCFECQRLLSEILERNFPPILPNKEVNDYTNFSREIWLSYDHLIKTKYTSIPISQLEDEQVLMARLYNMVSVAFEDYYDRFGITPVNLKGKIVPSREQLVTMTPEITSILSNLNLNYETRLKNLTDYLNKQMSSLVPKGDSIIQIGFTMQRLGQKDPYLKGCFTVDSCANITNDDLIKDENTTEFTTEELNVLLKRANDKRKTGGEQLLSTSKDLINYYIEEQKKTDHSNILLKSFHDEASMIKAFAELVNLEDPDMVGGYNTFGFDDQYLADRAKELAITEVVLGKLTRLKNDLSLIRAPAGTDLKGDNDEKEKAKGKKKMETHYLEMKGRVPFDIYRIIPANHTLPEYKLNYVCRHFFKKVKNDVPPTQIPILQRGSAIDRANIARYCIIDCVLCNRLLDHLVIIPNLIAMANVSIVPIRYLLFRGQTIKGYSLVIKKCGERGKIVRTLRKEERQPNADKYEGALVLEPLIDVYDQPISVADFNSLYPCSMISENISNDTLVSDPKYDNLPGFEYNTITYDEFYYQQARHKKTGAILKRQVKLKRDQMRTCRFVGNKMGILPEIEDELIASRNFAKKKMKEHANEPSLKAAWDCQQLAYKVTCNSIYGITGAGVSPIYNKDVAASITATGRKMIMFSKNYVEKNYIDLPVCLKEANINNKNVLVKNATCVYGDTDSIFIKFDMYDQLSGKKLEGMDAVFASMEICNRAAKEISLQLKAPQNLAFEKTIYPFLLINKKMYRGNYYEEMNNFKYSEKTMGFATKKRDSAPIAKQVVDGLTNLLFSTTKDQVTQRSIANYLTEQFKMILSGTLPLEKFIRTKSWKGYYQNPEAIAQHVLAVRQAIRDPGNQFQVNDRIPFVHIVNPKAKLQGDRIETVDYVKKHGLKIDYQYYIEKQLIKPLLKILSPNKNLGITEKWISNILNILTKSQQHISTMDQFFQMVTKDKTRDLTISISSSDSSDSD